MKEIKAYVRPGPLAHIIDRLEDEGACDLAVTHVERLVAVLRETSANGVRGDARIFVLNVESAVNSGHGSEGRGERASPA